MRVLLAFTLAAGISAAQEPGHLSMVGINTIPVCVPFLDGAGTGRCADHILTKSLGLLEDPIRTETELLLREVGLKIGAGQALQITVAACPSIATIDVELKEWATVDVRSQHGMVATWRIWGFRPNSAADVRQTIREYVSEHRSKMVQS